jgi:hypothetical protein
LLHPPASLSRPNSGQSSKQTYVYNDTLGNCYSRELQAANNILNKVTDGQGSF